MTEHEIKSIVEETVKAIKRQGLMKSFRDSAFSEVKRLLIGFYRDGVDENHIEEAVAALENDPYFRILPFTYESMLTNERIAERLDVEVSTVTRNKKRLYLAIYDYIYSFSSEF